MSNTPAFLTKTNQLNESFNLFDYDLGIGSFSLHNRRFLGNKYKLLNFIEGVINKEVKEYNSFCDIFAGTGVVGSHFNKKDIKIIANDILYSSYVSLKAFLGNGKRDVNNIEDKINYLNSLKPTNNYFSEHFGGRYFTEENAGLIGSIREELETLAENDDEKHIMLSSLLYAVDKVANTVGHYDAYRKNMTSTQRVILKIPSINEEQNFGNEIFQKNANDLIREIKVDVLYLDPPYNSRQYSDTYHLLENLALWEKPEVKGKAKKMDRGHIKSKYCLKDAPDEMRDLIKNADVKHILVSYNNTGMNKDGRSNARITDKEMFEILSLRGEVKIYEQDYKAFTTGKSSSSGNIERVFYCRIK